MPRRKRNGKDATEVRINVLLFLPFLRVDGRGPPYLDVESEEISKDKGATTPSSSLVVLHSSRVSPECLFVFLLLVPEDPSPKLRIKQPTWSPFKESKHGYSETRQSIIDPSQMDNHLDNTLNSFIIEGNEPSVIHKLFIIGNNNNYIHDKSLSTIGPQLILKRGYTGDFTKERVHKSVK